MVLLSPPLDTCTRDNLFLLQAEGLAQHSVRCSSDIDFLWREYFRDPFQWRDNRKSKSNAGSPDFKHKTAQESLWFHGLHNPPWVQEELKKRGLYSLEAEIGEEKKQRKDCGVHLLEEKGHTQNDIFEGVSIVASLKACVKRRDLQEGSRLHTHIIEKGLLKTNIFVGNTLVNMYATCGAFDKAEKVFDELPFRTVVSWNALITGYAHEGLGEEAFKCLEQMKLEGFSPNDVTFACALNACGSIGNIQKGQELHAEIVKFGLLKEGAALGTALLDMYANCGMMEEAQEVFKNLLDWDVIAWTALIAGYAQRGDAKEALDCYERMQSEECFPNAVTYSCILKACGSIGALERGREIHAKIVQKGLLQKDHVVANALLDMYAKCGLLEKVKGLFDELPGLDVVSWTALITGYTLYGFAEEALLCFKKMLDEGFPPDVVTFSCVLKACSIIGAVSQSQEIHSEIVRDGFLGTNRAVCTALVDMYANCGMLLEAQEVFDNMLKRDVIVWTALMEGYAQLGKDNIVFNLFDKMRRGGVKPNLITFTVLLNSCCHRGLLEEGELYFKMLSKCFDMLPTLELHTCMVDLFGRAGHSDQALAIMEEMLYFASPMMWHTLLCACRSCFDTDHEAWAISHASRLDVRDASTYVCISNMYAAGRQVDEEIIGMWE